MLTVNIANVIYGFTNLDSKLTKEIRVTFKDFALHTSSSLRNITHINKKFSNIWAFKTFLKKRLPKDAVRKNMLMVHSAAFTYKKNAYIFLGESESGKSTLIKKVEGFATILNDETNIVDVQNLILYSTPFWGEVPKFTVTRVCFNKIFILKKQGTNSVKAIDKKEAVFNLLKTTLIDINSIKTKQFAFKLIMELSQKVPFYLFSYKLNCNFSELLEKII